MAETRSITIAAFGDSLFEGWGLPPAHATPTLLQALLAEAGIVAKMLNFGVSGETAGDGLRRVGRVVHAEPNLAVLEFGANDFYQLVEPERMETQLATIIETLQASNIHVLLVGIRALAEFTGESYKARFDPIFPRLADRFSIPLHPDIFAAYLNEPSMLLPDGIHPNEAGAASIAHAIFPDVLDALAAAE